MFEKPQKLEGKHGPEQMAEFAGDFAQREAKLNIPPKRAGAFVFLTFMALSGAMGNKAEAQVRGVGPQSWRSQRMVSEIIGSTASGVSGTIDRQESVRRGRVEHEYVAQLTQLEDQERKLDQEYSQKRDQIKKDDTQARAELDGWYRVEKNRFAKTKIELKQQYEKARRPSAKQRILQGVIRGTRGW